LRAWRYEVVACSNGRDGLRHLEQPDGPLLAVLDWMMPDLDGPEVCRRVRAHASGTPRYLILLTSKDHPENTVVGLEAGADDYVTKLFDPGELCARVRAGRTW
jgi:DNA-binding response OmpR family regulator